MGRRAVIALMLCGAGAAGMAAWWVYGRSGAASCVACSRAIHPHSLTSGLIDGKPARFCCPMCAVTEYRQTGKRVRVTELTAFDTGAKLAPESAILVRNSDINPCMDGGAHLSGDKQPLHVHFDRCSPSVLAFSKRETADTFVRAHGGRIVRFAEMEAEPTR
jgi:hypothetical protein